jgi:uncharacterized protein
MNHFKVNYYFCNSSSRTFYLFWILLPIFIITGCGAVATKTKFYAPVTTEFEAGNYDAAVEKFEKAKGKFDQKDRFLYYLDSGALYYYASLYDSSNVKLTAAENAAEELFTKSISRAATSMILNDNILEYSGEDYEILYTNLLKALNYLELGSFDDAFVEIRRANLKLQLLEQKYLGAAAMLNRTSLRDTLDAKPDYEPAKVRFNNDAFARYLSMHIYAAEGKFDDAKIDYDLLQEAFDTQPDIYNFAPPEVNYAPDSGAILSIVGLCGLSPVKEALNLRIRTDKDLGLVQVLYTDDKNHDVEFGNLPLPVKADYYFKFAIPQLVVRPTPVSNIKVYADSQFIGELSLLEDVSKVAEETFKAKSSLVYLRSVARAVAKGLATHKLKTKVDSGGWEGWLKKAAIDVGSDISENADLRCSRFLPGRIYVADFNLSPGIYDLKIEFLDSFGNLIDTYNISGFCVKADRLNLVQAFCTKL